MCIWCAVTTSLTCSLNVVMHNYYILLFDKTHQWTLLDDDYFNKCSH